MFSLNTENGEIVMNVGDTGSFEVEAERIDGEAWTEDDRATLSIKNANKETVLERVYPLIDTEDETLEPGVFRIEFHNNDTDSWEPGAYTWEIRYAIHPYYDEQGKIVDGDGVDTPGVKGDGNPMPMTLKAIQYPI